MNRRLNALTADDIEEAAKNLQPDPIRTWAAEVKGKLIPPKQLVRAAANQLPMPTVPQVTPADFISHQAVKLLRNNGFAVHYRRAMTHRVACGHDPRRCCDDCCPGEEGARDDQGGGCYVCHGALSLPRVGAGMTAEQARVLVEVIVGELDVTDLHAARVLQDVLAEI